MIFEVTYQIRVTDIKEGQKWYEIFLNKTPDFIPLDSLVSSTKQEDSSWYSTGTYITTEGYLINAIEEGAGSCNCGLADANSKKKITIKEFWISPVKLPAKNQRRLSYDKRKKQST